MFKYVLATAAVALVGLTGAASASGLTEGQARHAMWGKCNNPSNLSQDTNGVWHGYCSAGRMMVDAQGQVLPDTGPAAFQGMSEPQARSALLAKCNNVSTLHADNKGNWHGLCSSGPMMVDAQGNVGPDKPGIENGLTEAHARSIAWANCVNPSAMHLDAAGNWIGYCGGRSMRVDASGKFAYNN